MRWRMDELTLLVFRKEEDPMCCFPASPFFLPDLRWEFPIKISSFSFVRTLAQFLFFA